MPLFKRKVTPPVLAPAAPLAATTPPTEVVYRQPVYTPPALPSLPSPLPSPLSSPLPSPLPSTTPALPPMAVASPLTLERLPEGILDEAEPVEQPSMRVVFSERDYAEKERDRLEMRNLLETLALYLSDHSEDGEGDALAVMCRHSVENSMRCDGIEPLERFPRAFTDISLLRGDMKRSRIDGRWSRHESAKWAIAQ